MFHSGDLQSGIGLAVQQRKAVLCFVHDDSQQSTDWEHVLTSGPLVATTITPQAVMLKIRAGSQEAALLSPICALDNTPAIVVIKNAAVQANIQANDIDTAQLQSRLESLFGSSIDNASPPGRQEATVTVTHQAASAPEQPPPPTSAPSPSPPTSAPSPSLPTSAPSSTAYLALPPSDGQFRLPNNAYDALREHTQQLLHQDTPHQDIYQTQLRLLNRLPILRDEVRRLRSVTANPALSDYARDKLLRIPAAAVKAQVKVETSKPTAQSAQPAIPEQGSTSRPQDPPSGGQHLANSSTRPNRGGEYVYIQPDSNQPLSVTEEQSRREADAAEKRAERTEWKHQQPDREARDKIKGEIAADREERRRLAEIRGQNERSVQAETESEAKRIKTLTQTVPESIRVQVRSFDGSVLRGTFKHDSTIAGDIRPFVDEKTGSNVPYNLKVILTPLPNRNIEAAEEDLQLSDLGIKGSCTLVMVPVKAFVESYSGTSSGLVRNVLGMGYGLASGTAGAVWGVGRYVLGYNATNQAPDTVRQAHKEASNAGGQQQTSSAKMRVRTLADQRAEERDRRGTNSQLYNGNQLNFEPNREDDDDTQKRD
ncbi:hypothetical protein DV736_g5601, partial [Chaetothyriales sp. CBS 134916]